MTTSRMGPRCDADPFLKPTAKHQLMLHRVVCPFTPQVSPVLTYTV